MDYDIQIEEHPDFDRYEELQAELAAMYEEYDREQEEAEAPATQDPEIEDLEIPF